jgi:predicted Rossmann fold nucleotide-binding protein DprA/Smf involved in DNA uptake
MRIGIVGSREFPQLKLVDFFINDLPMGVTIVSGGAKGVDSYAVDYAKKKDC